MSVAAAATRDEIAAEIAAIKRKYDRMPRHWEARRLAAMKDIDRLVDRWLLAAQQEHDVDNSG